MRKKGLLSKIVLLMAILCVGVGTGWATPTTYSFSSIPTSGWKASGGSQTINGVTWTYSSSEYIGYGGGNNGIQVGSKNNPQTSDWTIQTPITSFGTNKVINTISIKAKTTNNTATYDISAGGTSVKSGSLTTSEKTYSASEMNVTTGDIVITMKGSTSSAAMYLYDISVTYDDASTDPLINASDVVISADVTSGEFSYSITNPVENTSLVASVTSGDSWLSNATVDAINGKVTFSATENTDF